jgi:uncharacterized protein with von Willebrand factor type A (vWA) domain
MQYKVVPFTANLSHQDQAPQAASQLEKVIGQYSSQGWEYVRLESVDTYITADAGCFWIRAKPAANISISMIIFRKP